MRRLPVLICCYFAAHAALRVWIGLPLLADESELMVSTQALRWGYGPQPPLYTWIQIAAFNLMGPGVLALALVKQSCLAAFYLGTWKAARVLAPGQDVGAVAVLSLFLLPFVAGEMPFDLTHSVLMAAFVAWATWAYLCLLTRGAWRDYIAFGLLSALGVLAKLNALPLLAGLLLAGAFARESRSRVLAPRMLASLVLAAVVLAIPAYWMATHLELMAGRLSKLHPSAGPEGLVMGPAELLLDTGDALWVATLAHGLVFWLRRPPADDLAVTVEPWLRRVVTLALVLTYLQLVGVVVVGRATTFLTRWMLPALCLAPLAAAAWAAPRFTPARVRRFTAVAVLPAMLALLLGPYFLGAGLPGPLEGFLVTKHRRNTPDRAIAAWMPPTGTVLTDQLTFAGSLRIYHPSLRVATSEYADLGLDYGRPVVLLWSGHHGGGPPADLTALHRRLFGSEPDGPISRLAAPRPGPTGGMAMVYRMEVR